MQSTFYLKFTDLQFDVQQEIIEDCAKLKYLDVKEEGMKYLEDEWHDPIPETWEEAYVRYINIDSPLWRDYEDGIGDRPKDGEWEDWLKLHLEDLALRKLSRVKEFAEIDL